MPMELSTFYLIMTTLDVLAALVALYIFYRLILVYLKLQLTGFLVLSLGFSVLFFSFMVSAGYYLNAYYDYQSMIAYMPEWMRQMHGEMMREMGMMPAHWPHMMGMFQTGPSSTSWFVVHLLFISSYLLILAGILSSRLSVTESQENKLLLLGFMPLVFSVNTIAVILLAVIIAVIHEMNRDRIPIVVVGYILLLFSHILESLASGTSILWVLVLSEILRPLALLSIAVGVGYARK